MKKIDCILLVDDSPSTNFYNKKLIDVQNMAEHVFDVENGLEALNFILNKGEFKNKTKYPHPNVIFLDINMPKMDGFQFMKEYQKLPKSKRVDMLIVFLTTSNWGKDKVKALEHGLVFDFIEKPLDPKVLKKVLKYYTSEAFHLSA